jgi:hypothetical protein
MHESCLNNAKLKKDRELKKLNDSTLERMAPCSPLPYGIPYGICVTQIDKEMKKERQMILENFKKVQRDCNR